jgi:RNase H-fold protein (predicted Holliday junction resolvase)
LKILALDVSTSRIGWSIFDDNGNLIQDKVGYISLEKIKSGPYDKLDVAKEALEKICEENTITEVVLEAALERVQRGKSSAHVINLLIAFNFSVSYALYKLKKNISHISFIHARSLTGIHFPKKSKPEEKKELIRQYCENKYKQLIFEKKKTGKFKDYCYDITDSIIIGEAFVKDRKNKSINSGISKSFKKKTSNKKRITNILPKMSSSKTES